MKAEIPASKGVQRINLVEPGGVLGMKKKIPTRMNRLGY